MKPHLLKIHNGLEHSFSVRYDVVPHFYNKWHYHPEVEIVYIIEGSGQQFVGDNVHIFKSGDLLLLGSNLPHLWRSDEKFLSKKSDFKVEAIVIHFLPECFGNNFFDLPENKALARLLVRAKEGIRIKNRTKQIVGDLMRKLLTAKSTDRIICLLSILNEIAYSRETKKVCNKGLIFKENSSESERLNNIYQYMLNNYSRQISLEQIAKIANLTPHSFCRFFKSRIKKTFSRTLMEIRIGNACKQLAETSKSISSVCYECGYNNFSNFNRHFKALTNRTPNEHRKYYHEIYKINEDVEGLVDHHSG